MSDAGDERPRRWFGATGRRVPQLALEHELSLDGAIVADCLDEQLLAAAHSSGIPLVIRAATATEVLAALARPEVSSVVVPDARAELLELDLVALTYKAQESPRRGAEGNNTSSLPQAEGRLLARPPTRRPADRPPPARH